MLSLDTLPTEILIRIFSYFEKYELLVLERVSHKWSDLIEQFVWHQLTCIEEEAIDYPYEDGVINFIEIARRVRKVREFVNPPRPTWDKDRTPPTKRIGDWRNAVLELVKKRTPEAIFPLNVIQDFVYLEFPSDSMSMGTRPSRTEGLDSVTRVMRELQVGEYEAVRLGEFYVHVSQLASHTFEVYHASGIAQLPLDLARITRLHIGCLAVSIDGVDSDELWCAQSQLDRLSTLTNLQSVEIESIRLEMPSPEEDEYPIVAVKFYFQRHSCKFTSNEFKSFLTTLADEDANRRNDAVFQLVDHCKVNKRIKSGKITVHNIQGDRVGSWLRLATQAKDGVVPQSDPVEKALSRVYPLLTDKLHLYICNSCEGEEQFLRVIEEINLLSHVREFGVFFTDQHGEEWDEGEDWDVFDGTQRLQKILRHVCSNMKNLERLRFELDIGGGVCLSSLFEPIAIVTEPLPRLKMLSYDGLPSFPFVISVIKHAPNLRSVTVRSQPFEDEQVGLEWIKKLLVAVEDSKHLRALDIDVPDKSVPPRFTSRCRKQQNPDRCKKIVAEIEKQIKHLLSVMPMLHRVLVNLESYEYSVDLSRNCSNSHTAAAK